MKTVITQNIDGYSVIKGFSNAAVDPEATKARVKEILTEDGDIGNLELEVKVIAAKNQEHLKSAKDAKRRKLSVYPMKTLLLQTQIEELNKDHAVTVGKFIEKKNRLFKENAVYFAPKKGEHILIDSDYKEIRDKLKSIPANHKPYVDVKDVNGFVTSISFGTIPDYRGKKYYTKSNSKWSCHVIEKLNEEIPANGKLKDTLSRSELKEIQEQVDLNRISNMSLVEREKERDSKIRYYLRISALEKTEYDLQGIEDSLEKAKSNFEVRKNEMLKRYE
jgi:hypothetical protein